MSDSLVIVIIGATGDLSERKLIPALFTLFEKGRLSENTHILGAARTEMEDEKFRERMKLDKVDGDRWVDFAKRMYYARADATQSEGIDRIKEVLAARQLNGANLLIYLSVGPSLYGSIIEQIAAAGLAKEDGCWRRLVIEKPFGHDLASAKKLDEDILRHLDEDQVYRIDHYLGKETVQNIMIFRFANTLFEPLWNRNYIEHIQINVSEDDFVGDRGNYYDRAGVLRDMFQNHLLQLMTLIAMEGPHRFEAGLFRDEKIKLLRAVEIPTEEQAAEQLVCGQYDGYHCEKGVGEKTTTPTFAALRLNISNSRWKGVPFYLRSGKGLSKRFTEIVIQYLCPAHLMFPLPKDSVLKCNRLSLCIQPDEGIHINFQTKVPDELRIRPSDLEFHYGNSFPNLEIPEAYERLLQDAIAGDASLFMRNDEIERAWEIMDPFIAAQENGRDGKPESYAIGSDGPAGAKKLMETDGRTWLTLCHH